MMFLLVLLCVLAASAQDPSGPVVEISQGVIVGKRVTYHEPTLTHHGIQDGMYLSFYGIHYGAPTSGENRFKAPKEPLPYSSAYFAVNSDIKCAQPSPQGVIGDENCLVVNIHTKNLTTPKPVIVWLEGEEYKTTSKTSYSYKKLIQEGLVVVTMNYRLSIFGFLCLGVPEAPGNAGLKDIVLGLKWIQTNIDFFGGDPNKVTLLGHGSGGAMVDLLTMSPLAKGLFHNVVVLSGSALAPWAVAYDPIDYATKFGAKLNYTGNNSSELAKFLAKTDINVLSNLLNDPVLYNNTPLFAPCIENVTLSRNETFLSDAPIKLLRSGNYIDVPYIAGFTDREGTIRAKEAALDNWLPNMNENFEKFIPVDLVFKTETDKSNALKRIREFYFEQQTINMETIEDFLDYMGDILIVVPVTRGVMERALNSNFTIRIFEFAYEGINNSDWAYPQIPVNGVRHGGILNYLFNFGLEEGVGAAKSEIVKRLVQFVRTGSPQQPDLETWDPVTNNSIHVLYIGGGADIQKQVSLSREKSVKKHFSVRVMFWKHIYDQYNKLPKSLSSASSLLSLAVVVMITQIVTMIL